MKEHIIKIAREAGFVDTRFTKHGGQTVALLFMDYSAGAAGSPKGMIGLSGYYPVSHQSYLAVKRFNSALGAVGVVANTFHKNGLKQLAAQTGGGIGKNTLYYHPRFGSYVCMQAAVLDADIPPDEGEQKEFCGNCTACAHACPTGAISSSGFDREKCVRSHARKKRIPPEIGVHIYQMMGCEICQNVCPANKKRTTGEFVYDVRAVLRGRHTAELKRLIGPNMAKRTAILNQTLYYAANTGYSGALPEIEALAEDDMAGAAAQYARHILIDGGQ